MEHKNNGKSVASLVLGIIGVVVGILPGAGGDIGAWFAYSQAKKASKHPEEFGDGSLEAICASETANNAVTGGSIIPLITLGIPGSTVAAVLLGALILHGLTPGQSMFTKNITTTYNWAGFISAYWWVLLITAAFAYLLGSVNFAIIFSSI